MQCPYCGNQHPDNARFCPITGDTLVSSCSKCGKELLPGASFCTICGTPVMDGQGTGLFSNSKILYLRLGVLSCIVIVIGLGVFGWTRGLFAIQTPDFSGSITPMEFEVANNLPTNTPRPTGKTPTPSQTQTKNEMPTRTPTPTRKPTNTPTEEGLWKPCEDSYLSRLHVEDRASVSHKPPLANRVRSNPGLDGRIVGRIEPGEYMKILDGPVCDSQWVWWYVRAEKDGLVGWTAEGDSENYWLVPLP